MEHLGRYNLLTSRFVFGCELPSHSQLDSVEVLQDWISIKDGEFVDTKYSTNRTKYLDFIHIIELSTLEQIVYDLLRVYKIEYPFAEKSDFIEQIFGSTISNLERFNKNEDYISYGHRTLKHPFEIYFAQVGYTPDYPEYLDYALDPAKTIKYYKQYFKKVLELIENIDFDGFGNLGMQEKARTNTVVENGFTLMQKAKIAIDIIGDNEYNATSPVFHHVRSILSKYSLSSKNAQEIMLDMKGMHSPETNNNVVEPIIDYLDRINFNPDNVSDNLNSDASQTETTVHNDIFKRNAFTIWQSMWASFAIKESSRTDIRFMFDTMKKDGLIHKGTTQKRLLEWINDTYEITMGKLPYKDFKNDTKRNAIYASAKTS